MENQNNKFKIVFGIGMMLIVLIGSAYAFYNYLKTMKAFTLSSNGINATFTEGNNEIDFSNAYPISDEFAIQNLSNLDYIDFTVSGNSVNSDETVKYEIYLTEKEGNDLNSDYVKLYLTDNNNNEIVSPVIYSGLVNTTYRNDSNNGKVIYETKTKGETRNYRLYAWIDNSFEDNSVSRNFSFYVNIYAYNSNIENVYKVTFDANGGVVDTESKYVNYHEMYGILPEPTRDGYTFMGWNGKNLVKPLSNTVTLYGITVTPQSDGSLVLNGIKTGDNNYLGDITSPFLVKANVQYIVSIGNYDSNIISNYGLHGYGTEKSINSGVDFLSAGIQLYVNDETIISNVILYPQLEEGDTATEYEPFYIRSDTKVVQNHNHTLKAIWEENE